MQPSSVKGRRRSVRRIANGLIAQGRLDDAIAVAAPLIGKRHDSRQQRNRGFSPKMIALLNQDPRFRGYV